MNPNHNPATPPHQNLPPYPAPDSMPPQPQGTTSFWQCLLAAMVWFGAMITLVSLTIELPSAKAAGGLIGSMLAPWLLTALITWLFFRRHRPGFGILLLVSLPSFAVLALVFGALRIVGRS
ncbi:hypothetical protein [Allokutzneria oryzae]|uniref:Uncharacterized protein n=1 Tax=Allokutzneria oryzae TaxID=1378989 RepID=A0ABV6A3C7_9PSEU